MGIDSDPMDYLFLRNAGNDYSPLYYPGVLQVTDAQPIALRAGEEMQADFAMRRVKTVEIAGRVIGADGKPATDAFLTLGRAGLDVGGADLQPVFTDSRGEFVIKAVPPGSYILIGQQQHNDHHFTARQKIEVGESNLESVVLSFGQGTDIHGRVITEGSGAALDRIGLFLDSQSENDNVPQRWAEVEANGSFLLTDVPDGSYIVDVNVWRLEKGWFVKAVHFGATDALQEGLQVESGSTSENLEVLISSAGHNSMER